MSVLLVVSVKITDERWLVSLDSDGYVTDGQAIKKAR